MDSSPPGSSVHGLPTARILEWVAISFSRVSSWPRDPTCEPVSSALSGRFFTTKPLGEPQTLVWQQWHSVMIPRVWLFVISVLFKTSANSFQYKYLLIVVHLWLVSDPACEGNKSSQKRCTFVRIALNPHESFARYLMSTLYIVDLMLSPWLSSLYPHQFLQHLVFSACFENIGWVDAGMIRALELSWEILGGSPVGRTTIESVTLSVTGAQVTGWGGEKDRLKEKAGPKSEKSRRASLGIFSIFKQNQLFSHAYPNSSRCHNTSLYHLL